MHGETATRCVSPLIDTLNPCVQIMDAVCLLFMATLVQSGSGLDTVLENHAQECMRLVLALLRVRSGPLDAKPADKVTTTVSTKYRKKVDDDL